MDKYFFNNLKLNLRITFIIPYSLSMKLFIEIKAPPAHKITNRKVSKQTTVY